MRKPAPKAVVGFDIPVIAACTDFVVTGEILMKCLLSFQTLFYYVVLHSLVYCC